MARSLRVWLMWLLRLGRARTGRSTGSSRRSPISRPTRSAAYRNDVADLAKWADRRAEGGPATLDRLALRRYLASLSTRRLSRATIARRASADPAIPRMGPPGRPHRR